MNYFFFIPVLLFTNFMLLTYAYYYQLWLCINVLVSSSFCMIYIYIYFSFFSSFVVFWIVIQRIVLLVLIALICCFAVLSTGDHWHGSTWIYTVYMVTVWDVIHKNRRWVCGAVGETPSWTLMLLFLTLHRQQIESDKLEKHQKYMMCASSKTFFN